VPGWLLIVVGAALAMWANDHFVRRRTPAVPWRAPREIVRGGPYRFIRNPMYLGFLLVLAGIGIVRHNPYYLALLPVTWAFIHWGVVLREEPFLLRKFGESYQRLLDSTRRWI
jgi:protein-S-isoprenylcysteine O-methyltransferase Ste14